MGSNIKARSEELIGLLIEGFPAAFFDSRTDRDKVKPLEIGIYGKLLPWAEAKGYTKIELSVALAKYCGRGCYLHKVLSRQRRIGVEGEEKERPTKAEAEQAGERLAKRKAARLRKEEAKEAMEPKAIEPKRPTLKLKRKLGEKEESAIKARVRIGLGKRRGRQNPIA